MPTSAQRASTRKDKKSGHKKSARSPATHSKSRKRPLVVDSADEAEATATPQLQEDQDDHAAMAPQMIQAAETHADAVDAETPPRRVVGNTIIFSDSQAPVRVMQSEEPESSMTMATQMLVPVTTPAAQAARENATMPGAVATMRRAGAVNGAAGGASLIAAEPYASSFREHTREAA